MKNVKGKVRIGFKTKNLVKELRPGEIAVIKHKNLDEVGADSLVNTRVKAVINLDNTMTGEFPNRGPRVLLENETPFIDLVDENLTEKINDGDLVQIKGNNVFDSSKQKIGTGRVFNWNKHVELTKQAEKKMSKNLLNFFENTISYADYEKDMFVDKLDLSEVKTKFEGKECLIVTRGSNFKNDLRALIDYINIKKPLLIGVDGGADALMMFGLKPDVVLGDMDSVSDETLHKAGEILIHAYTNGRAPGESRLQEKSLDCTKITAPGTSEDLALLVAHQLKAKKILALGSHTNIIDFFEKDRKGMSSTILTRLKVGDRLIDLKGVSNIFSDIVELKSLAIVLIMALLPLTFLIIHSDKLQIIFRLINLRLIQGY
ncbi:putative cytokinetic ring protein SteA [Natranaerofaba carboxydovora]|uniref:putative cytokinetic ring protein SteA n=1 Tax=Natranaerofaba carboxydovora TaxID=2742683 RepID=UPI001F13C5DB|nr:putative cytokinetic ring protein SteA [Natranaerofaba carboxydovora]UMZ73939.1 thi_PPkinase: thiamine pyrophosphokinase [Natranaerofaba carboxydovora]